MQVFKKTVPGAKNGQIKKFWDERDNNRSKEVNKVVKKSPVQHLFDGFVHAANQGYYMSPEEANDFMMEHENNVFINSDGIFFINKEQFEGEPKRWGKLWLSAPFDVDNPNDKTRTCLKYDTSYDEGWWDEDGYFIENHKYRKDIANAQNERFGIVYANEEEREEELNRRDEIMELAFSGERS